ncbi:MAG: DUF2905 domain-containing protein [Pseudomonadales bacterium]|nr:DUF2905 domain-containing protein [Pseudomonadales bacterium]
MAKFLVTAGIVLVGVGLLLYFFPAALSWFGRLPGDIRIEREHSVFYFPLTSMILLSVLLSLIAMLFRR